MSGKRRKHRKDPLAARARVPASPLPVNAELAAQTRKQLGKHYANRYRVGRRR